eukprot:TRINITY_DN12169_c0_g1_i3.p1 TRINITY_DN12169_c0_g1~~TRINITY_DN12169_c0_g1_i3.p1  ORF type:complete len:233 (+),score=18.08 TRINITY_DN12169_c0_g1_i3:74-700(+)
MRFDNSNLNKYPPLLKKMVITENLTIRGLIIKYYQYDFTLKIAGGKQDMQINISNSEFDGMQINALNCGNVEISRVKFLNSPGHGFWGYNCSSIVMQDIFAKNCKCALEVVQCQNAVVSNINVQQCNGIRFYHVSSFEIKNIKLFECGVGLYFEDSEGKIRDVAVKECMLHAIILRKSHVRYDQFLCINNSGNNITIDDEDSTFIQGI